MLHTNVAGRSAHQLVLCAYFMGRRRLRLPALVAVAILLIAIATCSTSALAAGQDPALTICRSSCRGTVPATGDAPITYSVSDTASGTLGSTPFTDALVTVSFSGNTANVFLSIPGFWENDIGTATVTISGIGTATFSDAMFAFANQAFSPTPAAGIGDNNCVGCPASVLDTFNSAFGSYDLKSAIGPIPGDVFFRPDLSYGTTAGLLNFSSTGPTSTVTATIVPEPASLTLLGTGLVSLIGFARRRLS